MSPSHADHRVQAPLPQAPAISAFGVTLARHSAAAQFTGQEKENGYG
jgi:hypothetical protein